MTQHPYAGFAKALAMTLGVENVHASVENQLWFELTQAAEHMRRAERLAEKVAEENG